MGTPITRSERLGRRSTTWHRDPAIASLLAIGQAERQLAVPTYAFTGLLL